MIYIWLLFEDEVTNYFFDMVELDEKDGRSIVNCIIRTLTDNGLSVAILKKSLIGLASDGASAMIGAANSSAGNTGSVPYIPLYGTHFCYATNFITYMHVELMTSYRLYKLKHLPTNIPPMVNRVKDMLAIFLTSKLSRVRTMLFSHE